MPYSDAWRAKFDAEKRLLAVRKDEMHWLCKPSARFRTHHLHMVPRYPLPQAKNQYRSTQP